MIAWLLISFFVLLFLGVPIAMSLGLSAMGGILFLGGGSTVTIAQRMFEGMNSFALLAIPLYTFAGFTMSKGGISKRLMDFCYSIVGHIYGGLAHVNVLSSMIFAGISGSAVADTAGVSGMFMPEMVRKGYSKNFTVAVTAISSTIGIRRPRIRANVSSGISSPLIWNRSLMRTRCGEVKSPVFLPPASSIAFKYAQTLPFPFVPATWIILIPSCGFPRRERSSLVCSGGCFTVNFGIVSI